VKLGRRIGRYFTGVLVSVDQLGNAVFAGDPDETISSRLGRAKLRGKLKWWNKWLDKTLDFIDDNHSINSVEVTAVVKFLRKRGHKLRGLLFDDGEVLMLDELHEAVKRGDI
jgi:hypothetical protein